MKLIQITDLHIGLENQNTRDVDVRKNFIHILEAIEKESADQIIITGDFCYKEPIAEIYEWIYQSLESRDLNYLIIPGNHDDNAMMEKTFSSKLHETSKELFYHKKFENWDALFLDTGPATMSYEQFNWLRNSLEKMDGDCLIFMHHPPVHCKTPFMDNNHAFKQIESFADALSLYTYQAQIFCGHYHILKDISVGNMHVHVTPSLFFQIRQDRQEFEIDHYNIAYRVIELEEDRVYSSVKYLPGHKLK